MKFLKSKNISRFNMSDQTLFTSVSGRAIMNISGALRLPKGTGDENFAAGTAQNQRPVTSGVKTFGDPNGYIRYNTDTKSIEAYIDGVWEVVRAPGTQAIYKQTLGPGDDIRTIFGKLAQTPPVPSTIDYDYNIIVLVENVIQISDTNYDILYNHTDYDGLGTYIEFYEPVPTGKNITIYYGFGN